MADRSHNPDRCALGHVRNSIRSRRHVIEPPFRWPLKNADYRVIDGDTVEVLLDRGFKDDKTVSVRILGTDAPESNTRKNLLERAAGKLVTKVVKKWLAEQFQRADHEGLKFFASSESKPKYANRVIGRLWIGSLETELSVFLLTGGFVRPYMGGKRPKWESADLTAIIAQCKAYLPPEEISEAMLDPEPKTP